MGQQRQKNNKEIIDPVEQAALKSALNNFYKARESGDAEQIINKNSSTLQGTPIQPQQHTQQNPYVAPPQPQYQPTPEPQKNPQQVNMSGFQSPEEFERSVYSQSVSNIDPNLTSEFEIIPLPSKGLFYTHRLPEITVEKMNSVDEDVLSTMSLIENGTVLDVLIKRKIKTKGINTDDLLVGDRNAILIFLRATSYGHEYDVRVPDPRTGVPFNAIVDLTQLKAKEIKYVPDEIGEYSYQLPVRKVMVKFKILNFREVQNVIKTADAKQQAYNLEYSEFGSIKLKTEVVEIDGNRNKEYITKFIDFLPAKDSAVLKQRIQEVTPDINMNYEFTASDGYKFNAKITVGVDFFFPFI